MNTAEILSTIAIVISVAGTANSFYGTFRDRSRVKFKTRFIKESEQGPARLYVTVANAGRRPIVLRIKGGSTAEGRWSGEMLGDAAGGLRLGEGDHYDCTYFKHDVFYVDHEDNNFLPYESLWFEDSLGNRRVVPGSSEAINRLIA
jgi:hypothetical protein